MAYSKVTTFEPEIGFLESEIGLVTKTYTGLQTDAVLDEVSGRKLIKAGTLHKVGENTIGIVFITADMTDDEAKPISVMVAGRVYKDRLPSDTLAAETDLSEIVFVDAPETQF